MNNLQLRIVSALVLGVVVIGVTILGGLSFRLLAAAIAGAMFYEWCAMSGALQDRRWQWLGAALLCVVLVALIAEFPAWAVFALLGVSVAVVAVQGQLTGQGMWMAGGLAYAGLSGVSLALLRNGEAGLVAILFLFAVVWATDIFAYFVGRAIGGPKLAPRISPGKTRSGAIGGAVGGVVAGLLVIVAAATGNLPALAVVALLLSIVSQAGDLFESWVKRRCGVKDSGAMIPGHGGVMDRVDGLAAAAFALYVIGWLSGSADNPAQGLLAM